MDAPRKTDPFGKKLEGTAFDQKTHNEIMRLNDDQPVVAPLIYNYPGDAVSRQLDSMTLEDYLIRTYGVSRETIRFFVAGELSGGFGLAPDALSGFLRQSLALYLPCSVLARRLGLRTWLCATKSLCCGAPRKNARN